MGGWPGGRVAGWPLGGLVAVVTENKTNSASIELRLTSDLRLSLAKKSTLIELRGLISL